MLGLVCESCDAYNDPGVTVCASCGKPLSDTSAPTTPSPFPALAAPAEEEAPPPPAPPRPVEPATPPAWLSAPTGKPLATQFALPKVDLNVVAQSGKGLAAPVEPPQPPQTAPKPQAALCLSCGTPLSADDKFCRNCGTRVAPAAMPGPSAVPGVGNPNQAPMNTMQIAAAKLPSPNVMGPSAGATSTQMMPSFGPGARPAPGATMIFGAASVERVAKLILVRGQNDAGTQWRLQAGATTIGRDEGVVLFPDDEAIARRHCRIVFKGNDLWLEPEQTTNGVFLRVREPVRVGPDDEIVVGAQRLRVLADADRPLHMTSPDPSTKVLGSMVRNAPAISLLRIASDPAQNEVFYRAQRLLTLGRSHCDVNFPRDSFVSERHAQLGQMDNNVLLLEDLRSRNGTYLRARAPTKLGHGDLLLLGDKVLRVELPR